MVLDPATDETEGVLSPADLDPDAEPDAELDLDDYHWGPNGDSLLLERQGDLYLWSLDERTLHALTATEAHEDDPKFSPDGRRVAFVRDADLHVIDLKSGKEKELTRGGALMQVKLTLQQDSTTESGYAWTSSRGPSTQVSSGVTAQVRVIVERRAPITFILPILKSSAGLD